MSSRTKANPQPNEPRYLAWRGELIAKLALVRAGLAVQEPPAPQPFDLLASTPDGFYFLVEVKAYSSMHSGRQPVFDGPGSYEWPVETSVLHAAKEVNRSSSSSSVPTVKSVIPRVSIVRRATTAINGGHPFC